MGANGLGSGRADRDQRQIFIAHTSVEFIIKLKSFTVCVYITMEFDLIIRLWYASLILKQILSTKCGTNVEDFH